jgi:hypothetical protein
VIDQPRFGGVFLRAGWSHRPLSKKSEKIRNSTLAQHQRHCAANPAQHHALRSIAIARNVVDALLNVATLAIMSTQKRSAAETNEASCISLDEQAASFRVPRLSNRDCVQE